jgi:predicted TIM-barrel fold metal-dependent hydrolase
MHCHAGPSLFDRDLDYVRAAEEGQEAGMKALVIKDHLMPSAIELSILKTRPEMLAKAPDVELFGSICLNNHVGGFNPWALEVALELGAKVVWFPTVSSQRHIERHPGSLFGTLTTKDLRMATPLQVLDESGKPVPEAIECLELIAKHDAVLATGHMQVEHTMAVLPIARERGVNRIIITHPTLFVDADSEQRTAMINQGAYLEHEVGMFKAGRPNGRQETSELIALIKEHGADHTILSSDLGQINSTHPAAGLQNTAKALLEAGFSESDVEKLFARNAQQLLGYI